MADSFKKETIREINRIANDNTNPQNVRQIASSFADKLVDVPEEEVKKYLWANMNENAGLAYRTLLQYMPDEGSKVRDFVLGEQKPTYSAPDAEKIGEMFKESGGKSILDQSSPNFFGYNTSIDRAKVRAVAKANGMTEEELWKAMQEESNKMEREAIASGLREEGWGRLGTKALGLFMPRSIEAVREGRDIKPEELVMDYGENLLYATNPLQRGAMVGVRSLGKVAPKVSKTITTAPSVGWTAKTLDAVTNPLIMETAEEIANDDFSAQRAIGGATANFFLPRLFGKKITQLSRGGRAYAGKGEAKEFTQKVLGETEGSKSQTFKEFKKETENALKNREKIAGKAGRFTETKLTPAERTAMDKVKPIVSGNSSLDDVAEEIAKIVGKEGISVEKATQKFFNKMRNKKGFGEEGVANTFTNIANVDGKTYFTRINDEILPTNELVKLIGSSSWGDVLTRQFAKEPKKLRGYKKVLSEEVPMFTTKEGAKELAGQGISYIKSKAGDLPFAERGAESYTKELGFKTEKEKEEERKKEAERKAMQKYLFGLE